MTGKTVREMFVFCFIIINTALFSQEKAPIHILYSNEIVKSIIPVLEKDFDLCCCSEGGSMPEKISSVFLRFNASRRASIPQARELVIRCAERVRQAYNNDERVRPYLARYPFSPDNVDLVISFGPGSDLQSDGTVALVKAIRGKVRYSSNDALSGQLSSFFEESYEEALKIVTQSKLPDSACRQHTKKPYEDGLDRFFYSFTKEANKKYGIFCKTPGGDMRDGIKRFDFLFVKKKRANLEEARNIEMGLTQLLIDKINADEKLRPYLANYPFRIDQTRIRVEFLRKGLYDFTDGSLYSVTRETDNQIVYDKWDPPDGCWLPSHPTPVKKESYEEAQEALRASTKKR